MEIVAMPAKRSVGGIGKLYPHDGDVLIGEVYYSLVGEAQQRPLHGSIVFVGLDVDIPNDERLYRLLLEDGRCIILLLTKSPTARFAPYTFASFSFCFSPPIAASLPAGAKGAETKGTLYEDILNPSSA
jgi:hypothetical protein